MAAEPPTEEHYFEFSTNWLASKRLCGKCNLVYEAGPHLERDKLKPYTQYVCPADTGEVGHCSKWTGAYPPEMRMAHDHVCCCGEELVEEDSERWRLSFETRTYDADWHPVSVVRSKHASHQQRQGLLELEQQGSVRNVKLVKL